MYRALARMRALFIVVVLMVVVGACSSSPARPPRPEGAPRPGTEPRLVVLLVIDQWPEWSFEAKRPALTGGFARLLSEGEWHVGEYLSLIHISEPTRLL